VACRVPIYARRLTEGSRGILPSHLLKVGIVNRLGQTQRLSVTLQIPYSPTLFPLDVTQYSPDLFFFFPVPSKAISL
jgi:hypothetical protein